MFQMQLVGAWVFKRIVDKLHSQNCTKENVNAKNLSTLSTATLFCGLILSIKKNPFVTPNFLLQHSTSAQTGFGQRPMYTHPLIWLLHMNQAPWCKTQRHCSLLQEQCQPCHSLLCTHAQKQPIIATLSHIKRCSKCIVFLPHISTPSAAETHPALGTLSLQPVKNCWVIVRDWVKRGKKLMEWFW